MDASLPPPGPGTEAMPSEQDALRQQAELLALFDLIPSMIWFKDTQNHILRINKHAADFIGKSVAEFKGKLFPEIYPDAAGYYADDLIVIRSGQPKLGIVETLQDRNGKKLWIRTDKVPYFDKQGKVIGIVVVANDITETKQTEAEREATNRLLRLCNRHNNTREFARELPLLFQELTGCEAIGIRLRDGPDFPYYESRGFAPEFLRSECHLCSYDGAGEVIRDKAGNAVLACMCGQVLGGRSDVAKDCFTRHGSFWTNNTSEFRASLTKTNTQVQIRNRCNDAGYESVALIPLWGQTGVLGLLQFNDRRVGWFTAARIELLEGLAEHVSIAFAKLDSERALRLSEEHLRAVLDTSEAGYFFIDPAGRFQRVNQAWLRLHGYERAEEVIGKHFSVTQVEADLPKAAAIISELLAGVKMPAQEFTRRCKDGSTGYHTLSAHLVREEGKVVGLEGFLIDTTCLRTIREKYEMLFERMLDGFALYEMIFDPDGKPVDYRFLAVNPAFEEMTGLKAINVIGKRCREVLPSTADQLVETYGQVVITGEPQRFEEFSEAQDKHFEVLAFRPEAGQFACLIQDITSRKRLELQLLRAQKMEAIGQLAGGVAHDFNNILSATMLHLSLLLRVPEVPPAMKDSIRELETEVKRAFNLTRQLLMFSRRQAMQVCTMDLNNLITNLLKMVQRLIGEHIKLDFTPSPAPLWIEADPSMIEQVVMNLCVNARDAMPQGGQVTIESVSVTLKSTKELSDHAPKPERFACLSVSDTGCGMDAATLKHIYEPFFTTKEPGKGTGFGLATVYGIVSQHRGWIDVKSSVGVGTTFRVYLPASPETPPIDNDVPTETIVGGTETVLVIEDESPVRRMVSTVLRMLGYRVLEGIDGHSALAVWKENINEISVLFTDMVLPGGISGFELCKRFKAEKPSLHTIITTGYHSDRVHLTPEQITAAGIVFLAKPITAEALAREVRGCIDQAKHDIAK